MQSLSLSQANCCSEHEAGAGRIPTCKSRGRGGKFRPETPGRCSRITVDGPPPPTEAGPCLAIANRLNQCGLDLDANLPNALRGPLETFDWVMSSSIRFHRIPLYETSLR